MKDKDEREPEIYVASENFATEIDGVPMTFLKGKTRVRVGHKVLRDNAQYFKPLDVDSADIEEATAEPGTKRGR